LRGDHEIRSLQERFSAAITAVTRLDSEPSIEVVDALRRVIDDLDHEPRTTAHEPTDRYELTKLSDQARHVLENAHARMALDVAEAARQREIHAIERRSALEGYTALTLDDRSSVFDGFDG
jgi:hypothetical protein